MPSLSSGQDALINETKKRPHKLCLTNRILNKNSFVIATISGERRLGKSMLALMYLKDMYGTWEEAFAHMFYTMEDFINYQVNTRLRGIREPLVVVDDAGVFFSKNMWSIDREGVILMSNSFETVGTVVKSVIFTLPNSDNLIKSIRESESIVDIKVRQGRGKFNRTGTGYLHRKMPAGNIITTKEFVENYDVRVPDEVYNRYFKLRDSYSEDTLNKMQDYLTGKKEGVYKDPKGKKMYTTRDIPDEDDE
jgi:hypothetical protein